MPCEEQCHAAHISIHALREESDGFGTLEAWQSGISIHALREESDVCSWTFLFAF